MLKKAGGHGTKICILSSGYMLGRALQASKSLENCSVSVVDLFRVKPIENSVLGDFIEDADYIVTLEEQMLSGGFGSSVCEKVADLGLQKKILRIGLPEDYIFQNATREYLLDNNGLSVETICEQIREFIK